MNDHPMQRNPAMTSTRRSLPKSFSSFLLTGAILTVALLAFVPVAFGQAEKAIPSQGKPAKQKHS